MNLLLWTRRIQDEFDMLVFNSFRNDVQYYTKEEEVGDKKKKNGREFQGSFKDEKNIWEYWKFHDKLW